MVEEITEKEILQKIEEAGEKERVSAFDPDFLLILSFAILSDVLDIVFQLLKLLPLGIPASMLHLVEIIDTPWDIFSFAIIGGWMFLRTGRIAESKGRQMESLRKIAGKQIAGMEKQLIKGIGSPIKKTLARGGGSFLGESIPIPIIGSLLELMPFWAIMVLLTLGEK